MEDLFDSLMDWMSGVDIDPSIAADFGGDDAPIMPALESAPIESAPVEMPAVEASGGVGVGQDDALLSEVDNKIGEGEAAFKEWIGSKSDGDRQTILRALMEALGGGAKGAMADAQQKRTIEAASAERQKDRDTHAARHSIQKPTVTYAQRPGLIAGVQGG